MVESNNTHNRPTWDEYGMALAYASSLRSQDPYKQVGAAALRRDNSVVSTGYNGAPPGIEIDWSDRDLRRKFVCHAEINCLRYAKPNEVSVIYSTLSPCSECIKTIGAFGIKRVVYGELYDKDSNSFEIARAFGIELDFVYFRPEMLLR